MEKADERKREFVGNTMNLRQDGMELQFFADETFGVEIYEDVFENLSDGTLPCHWHDLFEFDAVVRGEAEYIVNGTSFLVRAGDTVFINSGKMHLARDKRAGNASCRVFGMTFRPEVAASPEDTLLSRKYFLPILRCGVRAHVFRRESMDGAMVQKEIIRMHELKRDDPVYELRIAGRILSL